MIKKSEITHGAIFAIPLLHSLGYLYGKMLFCSHLKNESCYKKDVFIKVYDYHTENLKSEFLQDFFKSKELFVDLFILAGFPKLKGENSWTFLRHDPNYEEDEFIPHYLQVDYYDRKNTDEYKEIFVLECGRIGNPNNRFYPFYRVNHLPIHRLKNYDAISLYLTFEWLRRNDKNPDDYFEYKPGLDVKKEIKFEVFNMAVDYRTIPKEIRGRVAPEKKGRS